MLPDAKHAFRQLAKSPGFTAIALVTLALGIGLNTSMFSLMNLLVLQPLPYPDKDHLVRINRTTPQTQTANHSAPEVREITEGAKDFANVAAWRMWSYNLVQPGRQPVTLNGIRVSANFLPAIGLQPEIGRVFTADEDQPGNRVAILSHATWKAQFGGDPAIVGQTVRIDGESVVIVGVMPATFSSVFLWGPGDILRPFGLTEAEKKDTNTGIDLIARYHGAASLEQLNTRLATLATRLAPLRPEANRQDGLQAETLQSLIRNRNTLTLSFLMLGLAGFVLLIACGNLANLLLARATARAHEFAVRAALGASRVRLLRPLMVESLLLGLGGGLLGLLIASWTNDWMSSRLSATGVVTFALTMNWQVLVFASLVSVVTGLCFGLAPAWLMSRVNVNDTLKTGGRNRTGDRTQNRFRNGLIVAQFGLALVLLAGAGSFIQGVDRMLRRELGWNTSQLVTGIYNLPSAKYPSPEQLYSFHQRLAERLETLPGAERATVGWTLPVFQYLTNRTFVVDGRDAPPAGHEPQAGVNGVMPSYIDTIGARLIAGRNFTAADKLDAPGVAIINESFAKTLFPDEDPIGRRIGSPDPTNRRWLEVVGVVSDQSYAVAFNASAPRSLVMIPLAQETWNYVSVAVSSKNPAALAPAVRKVIADMDADLPLMDFGTVDSVVGRYMSSTKMISTVLVAFACLGLFLSAIGLYGVIANLVVQRTVEIGIRVALGAQPRDVLQLVLRQGVRLTLYGAILGLIGGYGVSQLLRFAAPAMAGDSPVGDIFLLLGGVLITLFIVAGIACWLPARRASKVDPMVALRAD